MSESRRRSSRARVVSPQMQLQAQAAQAAAQRLQGSGLSVANPEFQRIQREEAQKIQQQQQQQKEHVASATTTTTSSRRRRSRHNSRVDTPPTTHLQTLKH